MLKVWNGSVWKFSNGIKVYTGSAWTNEYKLFTRSGNSWLPAPTSNLDASITITYAVQAPTIPGGGPTATVPNLNGLTETQAIAALEALGLVDASTEQVTPTQNLDTYVVNNSQNPVAGTVVAVGSTVSFKHYNFIPNKTTVPNLDGLSTSSANASIINAKLVVGTVGTDETTNTGLIGTVKAGSQFPLPGTQVDENDAVTYTYWIEDTQRIVPFINGSTRSQAQAALTAVNLFYVETAVPTLDPAEVGEVFDQSPIAATEVQKNSTVSYKYYTLQNVTVPNVFGLTYTAAETAIQNAGLEVSSVAGNTASTESDELKVYSQNYTAGSSIPAGTTVTITYYKEIPQVTVPNIEGLSRTSAQQALTNVGLTYAESTFEITDANLYTTNIVKSQGVASGTTVNAGVQIPFVYYIQKVLVPVTITETVTLPATWTASFEGDNSRRSTNADMYHGQFDTTRGNQKSMWSWDWGNVLGKTIKSGSITWYQAHTYNAGSGCTMQIGTHTNSAVPLTWGGATTGLQTRAVVRGNSYTQTLNSTIIANLNGTAYGITFGPAGNTTQANYGYVTGSGASRPSITLTLEYTVYQ